MTVKSSKGVASILKERANTPGELIEVLQDIQTLYNYLPEEALRDVAARLDVPLIEVFRVANFYKAFSLEPRGRHLLTVCTGTACHVRGAPKLSDAILGFLKIKPGETTPDGEVTVETVNCLGACALAPVVILDGRFHRHMTPEKLRALLGTLKKKNNKKKKK